jgi:hypothetical protein
MPTPLRLARDLRLAFPQFLDVRIVREKPYQLRAYCVSSPGSPAPENEVHKWIQENHTAGTMFVAEQVAALPPELIDEEALLQRIQLKRVVVEEAIVTLAGVKRNLLIQFPEDVLDVTEVAGGLEVHISSKTTAEREKVILDATRLFMSCDVASLTTTRQAPPGTSPRLSGQPESAAARSLLAEDRAFLEDHLQETMAGVEPPFLAPLPSGSSTYASPHDGIHGLYQRIALFDNVFASVPFKREDFPSSIGTTFEDFLAALPTGRIIPVLRHTTDRYEPGLISKILDGGAPRVLFHGEATLRAIGVFSKEHPLLPLFLSDESTTRELRVALSNVTEPKVEAIRDYIEAVADVATRLGTAAMAGPALDLGWYPIAKWLDATLAVKFGLPSRDLELGTAIDHRIMTEAIRGRPMSQMGHYLDGYLMFVYGAYPGDSDLLRVPDPEMIGRIAFPDTRGLTLREFSESFGGPAVSAMRALLSSTRVQTASSEEDLVRKFNEELRQYSRRADAGYVAICALLTVVGTFTLGIPCALGALSLELARRILGRKAPGALATIASKMTRTTREAALLARVKASS